MPYHRRFLGLALVALAPGLPGFAAVEKTNAPLSSPFLPAAGMSPSLVQAETLEFAGVSVVNKLTLVSLFDTQQKRGRWIQVGTTTDGIEVVSYDMSHDQVVVRQNGQLKVLTLRKPSKSSAGPAFVAPAGGFSTAPAANESKKPLTVAQQEEEARMFVADMLDIGMQNRKAYEEALKKVEADKKAGVATPALGAPVVLPPTGG